MPFTSCKAYGATRGPNRPAPKGVGWGMGQGPMPASARQWPYEVEASAARRPPGKRSAARGAGEAGLDLSLGHFRTQGASSATKSEPGNGCNRSGSMTTSTNPASDAQNSRRLWSFLQ